MLQDKRGLTEKFVGPIGSRSDRLLSTDLHLFIERQKAPATMLAVDPLAQEIHTNLQQPTADRTVLMVINFS